MYQQRCKQPSRPHCTACRSVCYTHGPAASSASSSRFVLAGGIRPTTASVADYRIRGWRNGGRRTAQRRNSIWTRTNHPSNPSLSFLRHTRRRYVYLPTPPLRTTPCLRPTSSCSSVRPSIRPFVHPSRRPSVPSSVRPSVHFVRPSLRPSISSVHPSVRPSVRSSIRPSVRPPTPDAQLTRMGGIRDHSIDHGRPFGMTGGLTGGRSGWLAEVRPASWDS